MAASQLLAEYRRTWPDISPTELNRLASTLGARISKVSSLEGGARLLPCRGGFTVLVDSRLPFSRQRTSIAHELVHTLFYEMRGDTPVRRNAHTEAEEHFCFDVARGLLAPEWMIENSGITNLDSPRATFDALVSKMKLSRPIAAQVMLRDRHLYKGIAGVWGNRAGKWMIQKGKFWTSPTLSASDLRGLKGLCRAWLSERSAFTGSCCLWHYGDEAENSVFVAITISQGGSHLRA